MKTKNFVCDDESAVARKDDELQPRKKLKQARLPFQTLGSGVESSSPLLKNRNKRKLSDSTDDTKIIKIIRPNDSGQLGETKENVCSHVLSDDFKKSSDTASKTLSNPCAGKEVKGHINDSVETSKISKIVIGLDENDSVDVINGSHSKIEIDRNVKNDSTEEEEFKISYKECSGGDINPDVIVLSDSEDNVVKKDLTISSYRIMPTKAQNSFSENDTADNKQNVSYSSPTTDSEQSDAENSPTVLKSFTDESVKFKKEISPAKPCATNSKSDIPNQLSPKPVDIKSVKCVPYDIRTPKLLSPQCSVSETSSKRNTTDVGRTSNTSLQNSLRDDNSEECNFDSETSPVSSIGSAQKIRNLTPKQLLKQLRSAKKKEEKERQRQEREQKKAEEKEEREKKRAEEKEEKLRQKLEKEEQKKKEKEEKEEQRRKEREEIKKKEKEEKERKKQVELEIKNEEKRAKDEEKRKKEDKRQAEIAAFTSFFLPKKAETKPVEEPKAKAEENFMPFEVKADMRLAPSTRTKLTVELKQSLDQCIESQSEDQLYLDEIRSKKIVPQTRTSTWAVSDFKDDVVILDDYDISSSVTDSGFELYPAADKLPHPKLLQFWENRRPPYWGTWRKKSQSIGPKNPFSRDEKFFDYEVDSDDEWEEEEPGESLHGSDDEKESEDEYEVDNEFFVPHGYLSDEENDGQKDEDHSPESLKIKLKVLELEFEEEMKQKTERLKPRLFGCVWVDSKTSECADSQLLKLLSQYRAVYRDGPIVTSAPDLASVTGSPESSNLVSSPTTPSLKKKKFPEAAIPALIKLIHGNINKREFLAKEFLAYWNGEQQRSIEGSVEGTVSVSSFDIFKKSVSNKIKELATWIVCPDTGPMNGRMCWYVLPETRLAHGLTDIILPNSWNYTFKPKRRESDIQIPSTSTALNSESNSKHLITKFTKKMSEVERKKQFKTALSVEDMIDKRQGDGSSQRGHKFQKKLQFKSSTKSATLFNSNEQHKRKVPVQLSTPKDQELSKVRENSLTTLIKPQNNIPIEGNKFVQSFRNAVPNTKNTGEEECIVLSD